MVPPRTSTSTSPSAALIAAIQAAARRAAELAAQRKREAEARARAQEQEKQKQKQQEQQRQQQNRNRIQASLERFRPGFAQTTGVKPVELLPPANTLNSNQTQAYAIAARAIEKKNPSGDPHLIIASDPKVATWIAEAAAKLSTANPLMYANVAEDLELEFVGRLAVGGKDSVLGTRVPYLEESEETHGHDHGETESASTGEVLTAAQAMAELEALHPGHDAAAEEEAKRKFLEAESISPEQLNLQNGNIPADKLVEVEPGMSLFAPVAARFLQMKETAKAAGVDISLNSDYRDYSEQQGLWDNRFTNGYPVAEPGTSNHGWGMAIDVQEGSAANQWIQANGAQFGFHWYGSGDAVHFDFKPGSASAPAPNSAPVTPALDAAGLRTIMPQLDEALAGEAAPVVHEALEAAGIVNGKEAAAFVAMLAASTEEMSGEDAYNKLIDTAKRWKPEGLSELGKAGDLKGLAEKLGIEVSQAQGASSASNGGQPQTDQDWMRWGAKEIGVAPEELASMIALESGFDPEARGGDFDDYYGLIQFGEGARAETGMDPNVHNTYATQMPKVVDYLRKRGFDGTKYSDPAERQMRLYATVLGGNPDAVDSVDSNGTSASGVLQRMTTGDLRQRGLEFLGGSTEAWGGGVVGSAYYERALDVFGARDPAPVASSSGGGGGGGSSGGGYSSNSSASTSAPPPPPAPAPTVAPPPAPAPAPIAADPFATPIRERVDSVATKYGLDMEAFWERMQLLYSRPSVAWKLEGTPAFAKYVRENGLKDWKPGQKLTPEQATKLADLKQLFLAEKLGAAAEENGGGEEGLDAAFAELSDEFRTPMRMGAGGGLFISSSASNDDAGAEDAGGEDAGGEDAGGESSGGISSTTSGTGVGTTAATTGVGTTAATTGVGTTAATTGVGTTAATTGGTTTATTDGTTAATTDGTTAATGDGTTGATGGGKAQG